MSETKFTPGPWCMEACSNQIEIAPLDAAGDLDWTREIAAVVDVRPIDKANAHLICAAPDLYAAGSAARNLLSEMFGSPDSPYSERAHQALNDLGAALAKARGEKP